MWCGERGVVVGSPCLKAGRKGRSLKPVPVPVLVPAILLLLSSSLSSAAVSYAGAVDVAMLITLRSFAVTSF